MSMNMRVWFPYALQSIATIFFLLLIDLLAQKTWEENKKWWTSWASYLEKTFGARARRIENMHMVDLYVNVTSVISSHHIIEWLNITYWEAFLFILEMF